MIEGTATKNNKLAVSAVFKELSLREQILLLQHRRMPHGDVQPTALWLNEKIADNLRWCEKMLNTSGQTDEFYCIWRKAFDEYSQAKNCCDSIILNEQDNE